MTTSVFSVGIFVELSTYLCARWKHSLSSNEGKGLDERRREKNMEDLQAHLHNIIAA